MLLYHLLAWCSFSALDPSWQESVYRSWKHKFLQRHMVSLTLWLESQILGLCLWAITQTRTSGVKWTAVKRHPLVHCFYVFNQHFWCWKCKQSNILQYRLSLWSPWSCLNWVQEARWQNSCHCPAGILLAWLPPTMVCPGGIYCSSQLHKNVQILIYAIYIMWTVCVSNFSLLVIFLIGPFSKPAHLCIHHWTGICKGESMWLTECCFDK